MLFCWRLVCSTVACLPNLYVDAQFKLSSSQKFGQKGILNYSLIRFISFSFNSKNTCFHSSRVISTNKILLCNIKKSTKCFTGSPTVLHTKLFVKFLYFYLRMYCVFVSSYIHSSCRWNCVLEYWKFYSFRFQVIFNILVKEKKRLTMWLNLVRTCCGNFCLTSFGVL